jgi:hypothetical protein
VCQAGECAEPEPDAGPDAGGTDAGTDGGGSDADADTDGMECTPWTKTTDGCGCAQVGRSARAGSLLSALF